MWDLEGIGGFGVLAHRRCLTHCPDQTGAWSPRIGGTEQVSHFPLPSPWEPGLVSLPSSLPLKIQLMSNPPNP